jgi:uncharacterized protein (DUF302 family)
MIPEVFYRGPMPRTREAHPRSADGYPSAVAQPNSEPSPADEAGIVSKLSTRSVAETVNRLTGILSAKGIKLFAVIDQAAEARQAGLELRDTVLVIFGSPAAGTPVMAARPLAAIDLPLKVAIWDDAGQTMVSYSSPAALAARHRLPAELAARLAATDPLTDALVAP